MAYNYLVLGSGKMAEPIAHDFLKYGDAEKVTLVDINKENLENLEAKLHNPNLDIRVADVSYTPDMTQLMYDYDVAVSAVPYSFNYDLSRAAIASGTHFCDLGGNNYVVRQQFKLDKVAKRNNLKIIPDCGIAPGAVSIIAEHGIRKFKKLYDKFPDYVRIRVGGIPQNPRGVLGYSNLFSVDGVINECKAKAEILRDGKRVKVRSMTGLEEQYFPGTFGTLEAVFTSGGSSTLTRTYEGKIRELDYKTLRYPGHWEKMALFRELGLFCDRPLKSLGKEIVPRELFGDLLEEALPNDVGDAMVVRVHVGGKFEGKDALVGFDLIDRNVWHTAMQRTTGYSASIVAQMMVRNEIEQVGVLRQEEVIDTYRFILEWSKRGIHMGEYHRNPKYYK